MIPLCYFGRTMNLTKRIMLCLTAVVALNLAGCANHPKKLDAVVFTEQALAATAAAKTGALARGSDAEKNAVEQFKTFNGDFSLANLTNNTKKVYAADVWFRDPFKEIHGEPEFEAYLVHDAKLVTEYSMAWLDVSEHDGDYYFRWIMTLKTTHDGKHKPPGRTTGISHVRFNQDGQVIFHQDYFDGAAFLYEKVPVLGAEIRFIKRRL